MREIGDGYKQDGKRRGWEEERMDEVGNGLRRMLKKEDEKRKGWEKKEMGTKR